MIAMALANEPELLIADEPTTALDVTVQLKILELLKELQARLGMALLLISHDLNLVRRVAHRVCVMQRGRVVEQALCEELFRSPKHPYTQELLAAEPSGGPVEVEQAAPLLEVEDLRVWFLIKKGLLRRTVDHIKAVDGVNFSLPRGRRWDRRRKRLGQVDPGLAILRLLASRGEIRFRSAAAGHVAARRAAVAPADAGGLPGPYGSLSPRMSVGQIIEGLRIHHMGNAQEQEWQSLTRSWRLVSIRKPGIATPRVFRRATATHCHCPGSVLKPALILLDEPTSALDRTVQRQVVELLRSLQAKYNLTYLFISHDLAVVRALSHQMMVVRARWWNRGGCRDIRGTATSVYTAAAESAFMAPGAAEQPEEDKHMGFLTGKRVLIVGVASKLSIARARRRHASRRCRTGFHLPERQAQGPRRGIRRRLGLEPGAVLPRDVANDEDIARVFEELGKKWDGLTASFTRSASPRATS